MTQRARTCGLCERPIVPKEQYRRYAAVLPEEGARIDYDGHNACIKLMEGEPPERMWPEYFKGAR
jgi:hypothetical protein